MPSNYTENYHLNQWEPEDQVLRTDFNADNLAIDEALKAQADAVTAEKSAREAAVTAEAAARRALETALNNKGNCTVSFFTYEGKGAYGTGNATKVSFPRMPTIFIIAASEGILIGRGGETRAYGVLSANSVTQAQAPSASWSGTTLSLVSNYYDSVQMNRTGTHLVIAFYAES